MSLKEIYDRIDNLLELIKQKKFSDNDIIAEETELAELEHLREKLEEVL